ncbi:hypothetical protein Back11_12090 [Paenibacillus baekrokdamisoli]|uniref:Uncharacterized protein n=1 Tax=Paenibacillus baekrokdamisoli TaxID=1712516 RepID=A0A3G9J997_9BACL|nr:DUF2577 domain-containing protein [Paenibacillus baekrokdamisoli]MBB3070515.1 hypothetical protein [Paenibacillus baekrokdamisoli]BBH19864.1 hypothetical protein Back11_12090 [Paenibacillus baekrokdamisoli]
MSLVELMKKISVGAVDASSPVAVYFGIISAIHPLEVAVNQRFILPEDFLVVPENLSEFKLNIGGQETVIRRGLEVGDKIVMLRIKGGEQYVILDRVVG